LVLAGFIAGVAAQLQQPALWPAWGYAALAALGLAMAFGLYRFRVLKGFKTPAPFGVGWTVFVLAALLGLGLTGWRAGVFQSSALNPALQGRDIAVTGTVLAMPQFSEDAVRFRLGIESARLEGRAVRLPPQIMLGWYSGFVGRETKSSSVENSDASELALDLQRKPQPLRAGERWQMTVRLKAPHGNSNPHGFDYELWLWEQGVQATGYVRAGPRDVPPLRLSGSWRYPVERARQSVREAIYARVGNRQLAGVLAALVVGDQNAIERADWDVFRSTGVAHLMSISCVTSRCLPGWLRCCWPACGGARPGSRHGCAWRCRPAARGRWADWCWQPCMHCFRAGACRPSAPSGCWPPSCCCAKAAASGRGGKPGCWPWPWWWRWTPGP
jgi:competence protein ComEC